MAKITPVSRETNNTIKAKTKDDSSTPAEKRAYKWWLARSKKDLLEQTLSTVSLLKEQQNYRYRQAAVFARLYGNMPLFNFAGSNLNKMAIAQGLPSDRPTMNVVQSCVDTLVSRITQARPRPVFLTDNGDYKERTLAKQMNSFIAGEFYQTDAATHEKYMLRDGCILGSGALKVYADVNNKVAIDRVLQTELFVDPNDAIHGNPRQLFQLKLVDRGVLQEIFPEVRSDIARAEDAFPDSSADSQKTVSDQIMIAEGWHLPSGENADDGRHVIVCSSGVILDEEWKKKKFPFVFFHFSPRLLGFWGQGLAEQLMGTQVSINKILVQMDRSIGLITPSWLIEEGSKMVKSHFNNEIGRLQTFRGTAPIYQAPEPYNMALPEQLTRLVQYAYQQSGISALAASSVKPAGLNSGEAIRNYDDLQSDRFADISARYNKSYVDLAYLVIDTAKDIAEETGSYKSVYPNKDGTKEIDLPRAEMLKDPVIQCFDSSALPRDPAGRLQKVAEMMQSGLVSPQEGRRLLDFPDIEQVDKLENAAEERIYQELDDIVESGKYTPPDPFVNLALAEKIVVQYINLYVPAKLEESKYEKLRQYFDQIQTLKQAAMPPPSPEAGAAPMAAPEAQPVSDLIPNVPTQGAA